MCHTVCVQFDPKVSHLRSSDLQLEVMRFEDMLAALTRDDINRAVSVIAGAYRRFRIRRRLWRFIYLYEKEVKGVLQCWRWRAALYGIPSSLRVPTLHTFVLTCWSCSSSWARG